MEAKTPFKLRKVNANDIPFIATTWIKTYWGEINRKDSPVRQLSIDKNTFQDEYTKIVARLIETNETLVACDCEDENLLYGFACFDEQKGVIHYVYIKSPFRRFGIAKALLDTVLKSHEKIVYTHYTFPCGFLKNRQKLFVYNPFEVSK